MTSTILYCTNLALGPAFLEKAEGEDGRRSVVQPHDVGEAGREMPGRHHAAGKRRAQLAYRPRYLGDNSMEFFDPEMASIVNIVPKNGPKCHLKRIHA